MLMLHAEEAGHPSLWCKGVAEYELTESGMLDVGCARVTDALRIPSRL